MGAFFPDALAPALDVHARPDVVRSMLVDETVPVTRVISELAVKLDMGREGELLGLFPVPAPPSLDWCGLDPDAPLRDLDPHAAATLVLRPILLRSQAPPPRLVAESAAAKVLLSTALQRLGASPVPLALALGSASPALLTQLLSLLRACDPTATVPAWLQPSLQAAPELGGGASCRNLYMLVRSAAEASGERASRFESIVRAQECARRIFLLSTARPSLSSSSSSSTSLPSRLASLHSDLLACIFQNICTRMEDTARLIRWIMSNSEALRRRLWSYAHNRHTSLAKRERTTDGGSV